MCGIFFAKSSQNINELDFVRALKKQEWRGPDAFGYLNIDDIHLGHVRLSILDLTTSTDQPMSSKCGRYKIIYNGEIYNHLEIRKRLSLSCDTDCDTETLIEGFASVGQEIFSMLDGMFALVIYDLKENDWWAARDRFGIKPLFMASNEQGIFLSSETISIRELVDCSVSKESIAEWSLIRRPMPGKTFFNEIDEVLPGTILKNGELVDLLEIASRSQAEELDQATVERLLSDSVSFHELSDVTNVCLLSGGIDSSLITKLSSAQKTYTVGLQEHNEIAEAKETARMLGKSIESLTLSEEELTKLWKHLIELRGEPLSVPNEGMIYAICNQMAAEEKVVLTGEGADEIFFGYDRIFREFSQNNDDFTLDQFFELYAYAPKELCTKRLEEYLFALKVNKKPIEFLEDFFYNVHLTGLLRRMDTASMAASKEARVPFVSNELVSYLYRRKASDKIDNSYSKLPLRKMCENLGMFGPINRKKIGFSSTFSAHNSRFEEYEKFREFNLEVLGW
ncbi:asparagine synthase (glutamine-hydrolyzing) [Vibrio sp. SCSIO 43136]|uniref:asparagine synthase (glutamine-hydrolyzing) n=1 Tax=Vibrio sp. SCSIO 43136 TaxID=2819101 RepID=UPI0020764C77|nr:asparagine synthase (glutamine-hydrolyzing) [Vibrio sp. SCSIO 43136]USD65117.1 asparagine synthase (glutamine-hydrolyzing) [Vibrio sp. SCSIO 43136]